MEERQKRRRRSIRNIRRRSEIVPFEPLEVEESKTEDKKCDTDGDREDVYGSLWMETNEPVIKKKKRRSSLFNLKSQQSNDVESASLLNAGYQPDYDSVAASLSSLNTQPSDYTNCSSLFNFKSQRNDGTKEDCKHSKNVDDRDSKQWNYTDSKILRKKSLGESIGEKETLSNTFSTEMSNGSLVNQDVQNSQIIVSEKMNDIESAKSPDCKIDRVKNSDDDNMSIGTPTNMINKKLAQNTISSDNSKSHSYPDGECILSPPDSANKSMNEHNGGFSEHTDLSDVVNTPPNLTGDKSRLPSMSPDFPASVVSPECNGNGRISVDSDCNSSLTSPSETSENSFRSTSMSPEYPETPAEKNHNSGKESYLSSLNDLHTEDLQMNKENSFNMNNSNTTDKVSPDCKLGTKVKDKAEVQKETNTDTTSPSYFSITKAIGKVVEFVKTSPSYIFGFDDTGKASDELSASPVLKPLQTDNIAAFEQKPGNCSLKQAALTKFLLKSDDILPAPDTCRIVGVGLNDEQNTHKMNKDTALKSPAKDIFTDTFNAVLKAFETPNEKKFDAASKSSKKEVREKPVFSINQINKETVPSMMPTNDNLSEHLGHSVDNACKNNEQSDDESSAVSFSTCTTLVEETEQTCEEKCVEINNIQNCEDKCEETIETKSYFDHEELGDTVTEQNMEAGPTEVNTEIDVPDRVCPEADSVKSLPQIDKSDFNIVNNDCSEILIDVNKTVKEETSTDNESEIVKSKRGRPRKKGRRSVDKTIIKTLYEAGGSSHELNINLPIDTEQTDDTAESKIKVSRKRGRRSGNIETFRTDIEMFRDQELNESEAKQETITGDIQTESNTEDQSQEKTSRRVRRRSAEVAALMIHKQNESDEKETISEDIQTHNTVDQSEGKTSRRKRRRSAEVAAAIIEEVNESCEKEVKVKVEKQSRKRKAESDDAEIEKIYRNKNYVKPEEHKPWQTIHESPDRFGDIIGKKRMQRFINFDKPTQMKLRRRSQKASKLGWNPASKKHVFLDDDVVKEKLDKLWADLDGSCPESPSLESALKAIVDTD